MKNITPTFLLIAMLLTISCGEDESCASNGEFNEGCFDVIATSYDVQTINTTPSYRRENLQISYRRPGTNSERISFVVRSNQNNATPTEGELLLFEVGESYVGNSMIFNGNINAPATGELTATFSKVDRENGLVSGTFVWSGLDTGATTSNLSGSFTDVVAALTTE